jgi:hypothetical protein
MFTQNISLLNVYVYTYKRLALGMLLLYTFHSSYERGQIMTAINIHGVCTASSKRFMGYGKRSAPLNTCFNLPKYESSCHSGNAEVQCVHVQ